MDDKKGEKKEKKYFCNFCDYVSCDKSKYDRHCLTAKHQKMNGEFQKGEDYAVVEEKKGEECLMHCMCGKRYKFRQGLYKHKKNCNMGSGEITMTLVMQVINQNQEFKDLIIQQNKQLIEQTTQQCKSHNDLLNKLVEREPTNSTINHTINNNHQKFNMNIFLNETCKDAMNIQEFLENIKVTFDDLMTIGNAGFVTGLSDILLKRLRDLEVTKRPIHCTDSKRETIYLKENDTWEKDDHENNKLKDVIEKVEKKNVISLHKWCTENPDSKVNNTPNNLLRDKIFLQTLQGDEKTRDKIIKNIMKEVVIRG